MGGTRGRLRVDDHYGQAEVDDGAAGLIIQVRSASASQLVRDTEALIYDYDAALKHKKEFFVFLLLLLLVVVDPSRYHLLDSKCFMDFIFSCCPSVEIS